MALVNHHQAVVIRVRHLKNADVKCHDYTCVVSLTLDGQDNQLVEDEAC